MISVGAVVVPLLLSLVLMGVFLAALYVVVAAAVEQGIRRSLPDASLRPSYSELRRRQQESDRDW